MEPNNQTTIVQTKSNGALVGSIIIIVILIIGGIYLWQNSLKEKALPQDQTMPEEMKDFESSVDSTSSIEAELDSIDLDSIDSEI